MDKTLVSIIVPVYNIQDYICKCLESLARQNYENIEIIIVDDGSTDKSSKICDEFVKKEKRARVYHKKNGGLSDARNFGIKKSNGKIIALVDGDDYVEKGYIKSMIEVLESTDADVVVCGFNNEIPKSAIMVGKEATKKLLIGQENIDMVAWNKLYKKELFIKEKIWYPTKMKHEDALTTYKLFSKAKVVAYLNKSLYHYVEREKSIMAEVRTVDRLKIRELAAKEAIDYFNNDIDMKNAAKISLLLAKYAFIDAAVRGEIDNEYYTKNIEWVKNNKNSFKGNKYLTKKLKLYNFLVLIHSYKIFRKII